MSKNDYEKRAIKPLEYNPFVHEMVTTMHQGYKSTGFATTKKDVVDPSTGEVTGETAVTGFKKTVDRDEFIKIFSGSIFEIFNLSKKAKDVFAILLENYMSGKYHDDTVSFNYYLACKEYGYERTQKTFISAMNEIINKRFIAPVKGYGDRYWINPNMFFKGDRMVLMQDIAIKGTQAAVQQEKEVSRYNQLQLFDEGD